jgi:hypothetical protein
MSSSSNSNTDSASWDGTLCTIPTTLSSSKNNFEANDDGFDYDVSLDGDNIEGESA